MSAQHGRVVTTDLRMTPRLRWPSRASSSRGPTWLWPPITSTSMDGRTPASSSSRWASWCCWRCFTAEATDGSGWGFAVVYATYQVVQTRLWYTVWLRDRRDHPEFLAATGGYVVGMGWR